MYDPFETWIEGAICRKFLESHVYAVSRPSINRTRIKWLLKLYMEKAEGPVKVASRWTALDVLVRIIGATLAICDSGNEEHYLPVTSGRELLTGRDRLNHTEHSYFELRDIRSSGFFELVLGSKAIYLLFCFELNMFAQYPTAEKKHCAKLLWLREVAIPLYIIFNGHRDVQHGRCGWQSGHSPGYDTPHILLSNDTKDAVVFTYGAGIAVMKKPETCSE